MISEELAGKQLALDFHEDEKARGITIDSANVRYNDVWRLDFPITYGISEQTQIPLVLKNLHGSSYEISFPKLFSGELILLDISGKSLRSEKLNNLHSFPLNLESLPTGLYLIHLKSDDGKERVLKVARR